MFPTKNKRFTLNVLLLSALFFMSAPALDASCCSPCCEPGCYDQSCCCGPCESDPYYQFCCYSGPCCSPCTMDNCICCKNLTKEDRKFDVKKDKNGNLKIVEKGTFEYDIPNVSLFKLDKDKKLLLVKYKNNTIEIINLDSMEKVFNFKQEDYMTFKNDKTQKEFFVLELSDGKYGVYEGGRLSLESTIDSLRNTGVYIVGGRFCQFKDSNLIVSRIMENECGYYTVDHNFDQIFPVSAISLQLSKRRDSLKIMSEDKDGTIIAEQRKIGVLINSLEFIPAK